MPAPPCPSPTRSGARQPPPQERGTPGRSSPFSGRRRPEPRRLFRLPAPLPEKVLAITNAKRVGAKQFEFPGDGRAIRLKRDVAYFITMNPGYQGRQELPENLKVGELAGYGCAQPSGPITVAASPPRARVRESKRLREALRDPARMEASARCLTDEGVSFGHP